MWREGALDPEDRLDAQGARHVLRRAWPLLRPWRRQMAFATLLVVAWTASILAGPLLVRYGIDNGILADDVGNLNRAVVAYVVVALVAYVVFRAQVMAVGRVGEGFLRALRVRVFAHLQRLSMPFFDRTKGGVLVSRMTSDVDSLQELVQMGLLMFVMNVLLLFFSVIVLAVVSPQLLAVCLLALPLVVVASIKFQRDANSAYLVVRDRIGQTLSHLQEGFAGVRVIQAFGQQDHHIGRFRRRNQRLYAAHMRSVYVQSWYLPVIELAGLGTTAIVVGIGGWMAVEDIITVGTVAFFILTLSNLFEPIQQLSQLFNTVQSAGAALRKLFELLDTEVDVPEKPEATELPARGALAVQDVSFGYGDAAPVLHDVELTIAPGERLALVGPTGAGKSTLAKLMARLYDPSHGRVTFGGVDLRDATLASLRQRIVVVPQEGFLFQGSIRDNVRLAREDATDREVDAALAAVGALERFSGLAEGLDTQVRERGSRLSAGEKQLVSLARAALVDPAVLVLDEATSSLDPGTEALVERAVDRLMENRSVIVIAHRLSTAERADRVGVVDSGELVEIGPHDELVDAGGRYSVLFETWARGLQATG